MKQLQNSSGFYFANGNVQLQHPPKNNNKQWLNRQVNPSPQHHSLNQSMKMAANTLSHQNIIIKRQTIHNDTSNHNQDIQSKRCNNAHELVMQMRKNNRSHSKLISNIIENQQKNIANQQLAKFRIKNSLAVLKQKEMSLDQQKKEKRVIRIDPHSRIKLIGNNKQESQQKQKTKTKSSILKEQFQKYQTKVQINPSLEFCKVINNSQANLENAINNIQANLENIVQLEESNKIVKQVPLKRLSQIEIEKKIEAVEKFKKRTSLHRPSTFRIKSQT